MKLRIAQPKHSVKQKARNTIVAGFYGWEVGFEPTTFGTTIRHSNQLSYAHHLSLESGCKITTFLQTDKIYFQNPRYSFVGELQKLLHRSFRSINY